MLEVLKESVLEANRAIACHGLAPLTWGNVSGIDRKSGLVVIKPSGVPYEKLTFESMVVVDLAGRVVGGTLRPSSDTPTHLRLYKAFADIGGITHTHSLYATAFAQAMREIPFLGTTHADHFLGPVPITRDLTAGEIMRDYEGNTAKIIIERFANIDPISVPAVLVARHAPFTWGKDAADSVKNAVALENVAHMALMTLQLNAGISAAPAQILERHHARKHGPQAYYGQTEEGERPSWQQKTGSSRH